MQGRSLVPEPAAFIPEESLNKYLLDIVDSSLIADVESFTGEEELSQPYRYSIRFTSATIDAGATDLLRKTATFIYRCDNPTWSKYIPDGDKWLKLRKVNGVITSVERISCSADETLYETVLEHPLALLNTRLRSAVYQNVSVPELVRQILQEQGFEGYEINFDRLTWNYPVREMLVQWKETDLAFIRRLLSEVGIWFRFEPHPDDDNIVVIVFSDSQAAYLFNHKIALLNPAGTTGSAWSIYQLKAKHAVVPASVAVRNYNYRASRDVNGLDEEANLSRGSACTNGGEYHYGDNHLSAGDRWAIHNGQDAETSWHYARIRHELLLNSQTVLSALTDDPAIVPGVEVTVEGLIPKAFETGMVITKIHSSGSRSSSFQSKLTGIPYSETVSFRPQRLSRPVISGTLPARISGEQRNDRLARLDRAGRYRVRFDFDQAEWKKGLESMPVRLGRQYAGNAFGFHFPLLDNTEVGIAFENGDPERPFIAHAFHDELNPDVVTNLNSTRNVIRTQRNNKLRMEDKEGEEHIKLATEYGKTQLNLGHLVDSAGAARGEGVELRTDKQAALRSAEGFHITTEAQLNACGQQNDMAATIAQLESALQLARSLAASAEIADTPTTELSPIATLCQQVAQPDKPTLSMHGEAGVAVASGGSLLAHAGDDLAVTAKQNANITAFRRITLAAGDLFSLFVRKAGMAFTAAKGAITLTAQKGEISATASQDISLTSAEGRIVLNAQQELLLMCGGAGIRLKKGLLEVIAPAGIHFKTPSVYYLPKASLGAVKPSFKEGELVRRFRLHAPDDPGHILPHQRFRLHKRGEVLEGITDENGESPLFNSSELDTWTLELLHETDNPEGTA